MATKLFVGNLEYSTTEDELRDLFSQHGSVVSASVVVDRDTGRSRGFGFVEYESGADADRAIDALDGADVQGRRLNVNVARPRGDAGRGRDSGGRGGFGASHGRRQ